MFSGIIAAVGRITEITPREVGCRLHVDAGKLDISEVALGDSIAHNGVCLTVVAKEGNTFAVDVSPETLSLHRRSVRNRARSIWKRPCVCPM